MFKIIGYKFRYLDYLSLIIFTTYYLSLIIFTALIFLLTVVLVFVFVLAYSFKSHGFLGDKTILYAIFANPLF